MSQRASRLCLLLVKPRRATFDIRWWSLIFITALAGLVTTQQLSFIDYFLIDAAFMIEWRLIDANIITALFRLRLTCSPGQKIGASASRIYIIFHCIDTHIYWPATHTMTFVVISVPWLFTYMLMSLIWVIHAGHHTLLIQYYIITYNSSYWLNF